MTKDEALKLALEALEHAAYCVQNNYCPDRMGHDWDDTITAIKEALAQPPAAQPLQSGYRLVPLVPTDAMQVFVHKQAWINAVNAAPLPEERNFCPRCGKRTADLTTIHTCTPPT